MIFVATLLEVKWGNAIFDALRDNPKNKIVQWNLAFESINPATAKSLAAYVAASGSLKEVLAVCHTMRLCVLLKIARITIF